MPATDETAEIDRITRAGVAAAIALARQLGLPAEDPHVLSDRGNLMVRLAPAPVVARVATLTAQGRHEPVAWLAREVAVAGYAAARGGRPRRARPWRGYTMPARAAAPISAT